MTWWLLIGAILSAFLFGGLVIADYAYRLGKERQSLPWADNEPAPRRTFQSKSDDYF